MLTELSLVSTSSTNFLPQTRSASFPTTSHFRLAHCSSDTHFTQTLHTFTQLHHFSSPADQLFVNPSHSFLNLPLQTPSRDNTLIKLPPHTQFYTTLHIFTAPKVTHIYTVDITHLHCTKSLQSLINFYFHSNFLQWKTICSTM